MSIATRKPTTLTRLYDGTFLAFESPILKVKFDASGRIGGFIIAETTRISQKGLKDDLKKISDIPTNSMVQVVVLGDGTTTPASQVIYGP